MQNVYVIDTNCILHNWTVLRSFPNSKIIIPFPVIEELDKFKTAIGELGVNSRRAIQFLDTLRNDGKHQLSDGVKLDNSSVLYVIDAIEMKKMLFDTVDNQLVSTTAYLDDCSKKEKSVCSYIEYGDKVLLLTKDINLRIKADAQKLFTSDYNDISSTYSTYSGITTIEITPELCEEIYKLKPLKDVPLQMRFATDRELIMNQYIKFTCGVDEKGNPNILHDKLAKYIGNDMIQFLDRDYHLSGIKHKNIEQRFAIDALLDDNIQLVTMKAKAGTGKTILAVAARIQKVFKEKVYSKIVITRPMIEIGTEMGFLPGDAFDKMLPFLRPIFDNLGVIKKANKEKSKNKTANGLEEMTTIEGFKESFEIIPLAYMRGRSISDAYIIIDEAQNLSPLEMKTILTRAGENSKIIAIGDVTQIDSRFLSKECNGLSMIVNKFRDQDTYANIELTKTERSRLAEMSTELLID